MGWSIGYDDKWKRDIGYGVPAICDHPDCSAEIDRGVAYVCADDIPYGGEGCGLYFCDKHLSYCRFIENIANYTGFGPKGELCRCCERCSANRPPFPAKPDLPMWTKFKFADPSWKKWRESNGHPEPTIEQIAEIVAYENSL